MFCPAGEVLFRCKDCGHGHTLLCGSCIMSKHCELELHRIEVSKAFFGVQVMMRQKWNGHFFEKAPLSTLGLRIQLGHDGGRCSMPVPASSNFLVFDVSSVHQVNVDFCGCGPTYELDKHVQLLRKHWFPATTARPQTVFTFECLDTFHELTLQGKTTLYDFYHVLLRKTDNANVRPSIVCNFFYTLFLMIDLSQSHSTDTLKCIALFACGKI